MGRTNHTKSKLSWAVICQFSFCDNADVLLQCHAVSCSGGVGVGNQKWHYLLWVGKILVSQMCRSFITFWPVELSCGRLEASHLCSDSDSRLTL